MSNNVEWQYKNLMHKILHRPDESDRTGTGTRRIFGAKLRADLNAGFPILTGKKVYWKGVVGELLWFLRGDTNVRWLQENNIRIWDKWANADGELGPVYGAQWAKQLPGVIEGIKADPNGRRHIVNCWQLVDLPDMALPPCHMMFQFGVIDGALNCLVYQRSGDLFLGVPFNIASYALLTHIVAQECGLQVGSVTLLLGDVHVYSNHVEQCLEYLKRTPLASPDVRLDPVASWRDHTFDTIHLDGYFPHPAIKAAVAV